MVRAGRAAVGREEVRDGAREGRRSGFRRPDVNI
jgi:hypothetical protein